MRTRVSEMFGIEFPIVGFSPYRDVVAAITGAGGLGVLAALYFTPEELDRELAWLDERVQGRPYGVDVLMPAAPERAGPVPDSPAELARVLQRMIPDGHRRFVEGLLEQHSVPGLAPDDEGRYLLGWTDATSRPQVEVALRHPIALLASALGPPPAEVVAQAKDRGVPVAALVGSARHALKQAAAGVDLVVAQGTEAGGHTGEVSTMVLVPEVVDAVAPRPVLAAGGIGSGRQIAAAMALGAEGVWVSSAWLLAEEAGTPPAMREGLLAATSGDTVRSRSLTGKPARMLRNDWTDAWEAPDSPGSLPMPLQFMLVADAVRRISEAAVTNLAGQPVGQIVGSMNAVKPAREVLLDMTGEYAETMRRLSEITGG